MASLDDILTAAKNLVVAVNNLGTYMTNYYTLERGAPITPSAATTSVSTLYTVPSNIQFQLQELDIINTTGATATFTIYIVPPNGTATQSNALFYSAPISGNTTVQWRGGLALAGGSTIQAFASVTTVTFKIAGGAI